MVLRRLFLAHYSGDASEVSGLAAALRLRGVVPWVDKDGGFSIADECESEARRAISHDCFGLLLYATAEAFTRPFIRNIEINEARKVQAHDPAFALFAIPRRLTFSQLAQLSVDSFGFDLSKYHTISIPESANLEDTHASAAMYVVERVLRHAAARGRERLSLQFSSREVLPDERDDVLRIDATALAQLGVDNEQRSRQLLQALTGTKKAITNSYGRPRLYVHGSKHLSTAFLFGRVFAPFEMDIRQTRDAVWGTDVTIADGIPLAVTLTQVDPNAQRLFVEVAAGYKNIGAGVDAFVAAGGPRPAVRLQVQPLDGPLLLDNSSCAAMVDRVYGEIEQALRARTISEIHLFGAVPQSFMIMLGRKFRGMPPVNVYEWNGSGYTCGCRIPGGVLPG
jgi:hypothetical protein